MDMIDSPNAGEETRRPIRRALVSVYDKTDLLRVAQGLVEAGVEIVSTGSTAAAIAEAGLPVTPIELVTGFPECLDGRVKTLHPMVHAGLLADLRLESHREQLADLGVKPFDLLISNLYPFTTTVASGATAEACIEQIDIGSDHLADAVSGASAGAGGWWFHLGPAAGACGSCLCAHGNL